MEPAAQQAAARRHGPAAALSLTKECTAEPWQRPACCCCQGSPFASRPRTLPTTLMDTAGR